MSVPQLVSAPEHRERQPRDDGEESHDHDEASEWVHVRDAEEAVAETVDHVEEGIDVRNTLPEGGERMDRVEDPRKECEGHDQKILEGGDLVDLLGPDARHHPERAQNGASAESERDDPHGMAKVHC